MEPKILVQGTGEFVAMTKERTLFRLPELMVSSSSLCAPYLAKFVEGMQVEQDALSDCLRASFIDEDRLKTDVAYRVPLYALCQLIKVCLDRKLVTHGALLNQVFSLRVRSFPVLGYLLMSSATVRSAIERLIRYEPLIWNLSEIRLSDEGDMARLSWHSEVSLPNLLVEIAVAGWVSIGQNLLEVSEDAFSIHFVHNGMKSVRTDGWPSQVLYQQPFNGIQFPAHWLSRPLVDADEALSELMHSQADQLLANFTQKVNLENEIRHQLFERVGIEWPDLLEMAKVIGVTPRRLRQLLEEKRLTYKSIQDQVRREVVYYLLTSTNWPLINIAQSVDFAEQSTLNKACRRWFHCAPGELRKAEQVC